ncbi:TLR adapter interacting with SLC15A4 on the lysosome [Sardina pilchardus]|uniref:TLR adapter interacting with SLC15A4 on the lysosome n=1 Tax=Sardina pilchardus TaxID=27697 RepID=UPI002E1344EB
MLCESRLWTVVFCQEWGLPPDSYKNTPETTATSSSAPATLPRLLTHVPSSPRQPGSDGWSGRLVSPDVDVPGRVASSPGPAVAAMAVGGAEPFLVPPSCHSICQHYSDLHIAGDQVLLLDPAGAADAGGDLQARLCQDPEPEPLLSCWVEQEDEEEEKENEEDEGEDADAAALGAREGPSLLPPEGRPLSNSQLNRYLEQKLLELYRQHLAQGPGPAAPQHQHQQQNQRQHQQQDRLGPRPVLASELLQTSLDQITLQLRRRDHNLEAARAKDMVMSCLLRVASSLQSSEISTPILQMSCSAAEREQHPDTKDLH